MRRLHRHKRRLPVVTMYDVGLKPGVPQQLDHRFGKEQKPLRVVFVIADAGVIQLRPIEEFIPPDEQYPHTVRLLQLQHVARHRPAPQRDLQGQADRPGLPRHLLRATIKREAAGHFMPQLAERTRQRADDIPQPARLGVGRHLAGCEKNLHRG